MSPTVETAAGPLLMVTTEISFSGSMNANEYMNEIVDLMCQMCYGPISMIRCDEIMQLTTEAEVLFDQTDEANLSLDQYIDHRKNISTKMAFIKHKINQLNNISKKWVKISQEEKSSIRRWKTTIRDNWNPEDLEKVVSELEHMSEYSVQHDASSNPLSENMFIQAVLRLYPEAYLDIKELIRTKFKSERVINEVALIAPIANVPKVEEAKMYHCLIQKSRYKFEYILGSDIDSKIKNHEIVFHDRIDKVNEDYVTKIESQMPLFALKCPSKMITFSRNEFVYKTNDFVSLKTIIKFYRTLHA